jgi:DNA replication protein DnaC
MVDEGPAAIAAEVRAVQERARRAWWEQAVPVDFRAATLEAVGMLGEGQAEAIQRWLPGTTPNLLIVGQTGTGKTYAGYAVLREAARLGQWTWASTAFEHVRNSGFSDGDPKLVERSCRADVLLLDDLGAERTTDFAVESLAALVDERRREHRRTIFTTNLGRSELVKRYDDRIVSRIAGGASVVLLNGTDRRFTQSW